MLPPVQSCEGEGENNNNNNCICIALFKQGAQSVFYRRHKNHKYKKKSTRTTSAQLKDIYK